MKRQPEPGIAARFDGDCPKCGLPIVKGDRIAYSKGRPIHCTCAQGADDE